jgi:DNA-directed RNA polymerase specialized sigma24 family protein
MTVEEYGLAYERGFSRTVRMLLSRGARVECAQEVAQAAWARGWERIKQLRSASGIYFWVDTIALNYYRRTMRSENRRLPLTEFPIPSCMNLASIDLERFLAWSRPSDRQLFEDYLQGYALDEIARKRGITYTALRIRLLRARRAVRSRIPQKVASPPWNIIR